MNNKLVLLVDGYNFYYRNLFVIPNNANNLNSEADIEEFEKHLIISFNALLKRTKDYINDVVFVCDSKSWRKSLLPSSETYKANRKGSPLNFNNFAKAILDFETMLQTQNIIVSRAQLCEGDDLIYEWSKYLTLNKSNVIIISSDKDLTQLISVVDNDTLITQFNPVSKTLYIPEGYDYSQTDLNLTELSLFSNAKTNPNCTINNFIKTHNEKLVEINVFDVLFNKILMGDTSDNIPTIYKGIGPKKCERIKEEFLKRTHITEPNFTVFINSESVKTIVDVIYEVMKIKDNSITKRMLIENIKYNTQLITLNESIIPKEVIDNMLTEVDLKKNDLFKANYKSININSLLENSILKEKYNSQNIYQKDSSAIAKNDKLNYTDFSFING